MQIARSVERDISGRGLAGVATEEETMKAALENYHGRMQRVLDHIDQHLDDDLGLEALSGVAAFSKYHFHRQFMSSNPQRHGHRDGCRLRRPGSLRPRLSATVRTIAFVVPKVSRMGAVACGLRA